MSRSKIYKRTIKSLKSAVIGLKFKNFYYLIPYKKVKIVHFQQTSAILSFFIIFDCKFLIKYVIIAVRVLNMRLLKEGETVRIRKQELGDKNIIGSRVEGQRKTLGMKQKDLLAQLQIKGIELNASGLSKLEGQLRGVQDYELKAIAEVLDVSVNWLLGIE